jgi:hypothetical protein
MSPCLLLFPRGVVVRSITLSRIVPIQGSANVFSSGTASRHKELLILEEVLVVCVGGGDMYMAMAC